MNGGSGSGNTPRRRIHFGGKTMYAIYNRDEGMYLLGTQKNSLGVLAFESVMEARLVLRRIGTYNAVVKRVRASGGRRLAPPLFF